MTVKIMSTNSRNIANLWTRRRSKGCSEMDKI